MNYKRIITVTVILLISLLIGGGLYKYLKSEEDVVFEVGYFTSYLESRVLEVLPNAQVDVISTSLVWKRKEESFGFIAEGLTIYDEESGLKLAVSTLDLSSKIGLMFLLNNFNFTSVKLDGFSLVLSKADSLAMGSVSSVDMLRKLLSEVIKHDVSIESQNNTVYLNSSEPLVINQLKLQKKQGYDKDTLNISASHSDFKIRSSISGDYKGVISLDVGYENLSIALLGLLGLPTESIPVTESSKISGNLLVKVDDKDRITYSSAKITNASGFLKCRIGVEGKCAIEKLYSNLIYKNHTLNFEAQINDTSISARGRVSKKNDVTLKTRVTNLPVVDVCSYWPETFHPQAYEWYYKNVLAGEFSSVLTDVRLNLSRPLEFDFSSIKVNASIRGAKVKFEDEFSPVSQAEGVMTIDHNKLLITINNAVFENLENIHGNVQITDINHGNPQIMVYAKTDSTADQLYRVINNIGELKTDLNVVGNATTKLNYTVSDFMKNEQLKQSLRIEAKVMDVTVHKETFDFYNGNIDLSVIDSKVHAESYGLLNNRPMKLLFDKDLQDDLKLKAKFSGYLSPQNLEQFKLPNTFEGIIKSEIDYLSADSTPAQLQAKFDLSKAKVVFPHSGWRIDSSQNATIDLALRIDENTIIDRAELLGKGVDIKFSGYTDEGTLNLTLRRFQLDRNDFYGTAKISDDNMQFDIYGNVIDLKDFNIDAFSRAKGSFSTKIQTNVIANKVLMKNDIVIYNTKLKLNYDKNNGYCMGSSFTGKFVNQAAFEMNCSGIGIDITSGDAGSLLRAFDILDNVEKGRMSFYLSPFSSNPMTGMVSITKFHMVKASILAKILTLASLSGIGNAVNGSGINFNSLNIPFIYRDGQIRFKESWIEGNELGISVGGNIDIILKSFDLAGQIIPLYTINKSIWKIPMLGKLLTGGKSRGLFAIDYKVKGNSQDYDTSVNFLSVLTPTLLKKILEALNNKAVSNSKTVG